MKLNITPNILDTLDFWRIESILLDYEEYIKEEENRQNEQQKQYEQQMPQKPNMGDMYKNMPKFDGGLGGSGFKIPQVNVPNFNIPKF